MEMSVRIKLAKEQFLIYLHCSCILGKRHLIINNIEALESLGPNSIFFIETNPFFSIFNSFKLCAIESASHANPDSKIFVLLNSKKKFLPLPDNWLSFWKGNLLIYPSSYPFYKSLYYLLYKLYHAKS